MPKFNMYQSLHTTVIGVEGKPVELQIRTYAMHRRAEYGIAAHWKYKEDMRVGNDTDRPLADDGNNDMAWVRQLLDWQQETEDPGEFLESLRFEINSAEVYVFTPAGDVVALPTGATPVDFAYAIHTEVGHRTIGARVNGRLVPLESALDNGDVVEVFTSKAQTAGPSRDWLTFVKSPRARTKIRQWFTKERREEAVERGKEQIARLMRKEGVPLKRVMTHETLTTVATEMRLADVSALYAAVGEGNVGAQTVVRRVMDLFGGEDGAAEDLAEGVQITGRRPRLGAGRRRRRCHRQGQRRTSGSSSPSAAPRSPATTSSASSPAAQGVSVHRADCTNAVVAALAARAARRGRVGPDRAVDVPGEHPGRGPRPRPAALRHHQGALGHARQHPRRLAEHRPRPCRQVPLHLRDGRPQAPRPRAARRTPGRRRLRRLPRHHLTPPTPSREKLATG